MQLPVSIHNTHTDVISMSIYNVWIKGALFSNNCWTRSFWKFRWKENTSKFAKLSLFLAVVIRTFVVWIKKIWIHERSSAYNRNQYYVDVFRNTRSCHLFSVLYMFRSVGKYAIEMCTSASCNLWDFHSVLAGESSIEICHTHTYSHSHTDTLFTLKCKAFKNWYLVFIATHNPFHHKHTQQHTF